MQHRIPTILLALAALVFLGGCVGPHPGLIHSNRVIHHPGPPPHAPAHGHRHQHQGVALVFQQDLGCYAVVGRSNHYWKDGHFFRLGSGGWQISYRWGSTWASVGDQRVPERLRHKHGRGHGKGRGHARGEGHRGGHPAKKH